MNPQNFRFAREGKACYNCYHMYAVDGYLYCGKYDGYHVDHKDTCDEWRTF